MRKMLSILLCTAIIISILCISVSSAEGSAIKTAADFAAMTADGDYYLDADITIDATYETAFTGAFDGNGHTVTVTAPMFAQFDGTVKDLIIEGTEISGNKDLAAFAVYTSTGLTAINVVNNVDIKVTGITDDYLGGLCAGGILANSNMYSHSVFKSCINNGTITVETAVVKTVDTGAHYETFAGGIVGRADGIDIRFSENHGAITAPSNQAKVGGIVGRVAYSALYNLCDIVDCTNTADITSGLDAAGMAANIGVKNNIGISYTIQNCDNSGTISGAYRAGGFVGYCYASGTNAYLAVISSINTGNVKGGRAATNLAGSAQYSFVSLLVGYTNSPNTTIKGCLAFGELSAIAGDNFVEPFFVIMGCSSADTSIAPLEKNYINDNNTTVWYSYATATDNAAQIIPIATAITNDMVTRCSSLELKDGSILEKLNAAAETPIFTQNSATDDYPKIDLALRATRASADLVEFLDTTAVPDTTTAPKVTTTKTPTTTAVPVTTTPTQTTPATDNTDANKKGGCGKSTTIISGLTIISILGSAVIIIKKH